jgi:hypothetical protein
LVDENQLVCTWLDDAKLLSTFEDIDFVENSWKELLCFVQMGKAGTSQSRGMLELNV